jgi:hypothetical protein
MAYVIKIEIIKPDGLLWFMDSNPDATAMVSAINDWVVNSPGFLTVIDHGEGPVYTVMVVFDTEANGQNWLLQRETQPDVLVRKNYYQSIDVVEDITIYP